MKLDLLRVREIDSIDSREEKILAAAVMYAESGFYVIPIRPNGKAIPQSKYNLGYNKASRNLKVIRKWFGVDGKFWGWNIGLACGAKDGIFVVDIDVDDDYNGYDTLAAIEEDYDQLQTITQKTPSGGRHYIFSWFDSGTSSTSKMGIGIDTRGGDGTNRSHIVAWPSVVDGEQYEWENYGEVEEAPDWFSEILGKPWASEPNGGRGSEEVDKEDLEKVYSPSELWKMLSFIDPNSLSYDRWLAIGQSLHSQHPNDEGLKLWDTWSQKGDKYEPDECYKRWHGFKPYGPIRIGTLVFEAKRGGFIPKPRVEQQANKEVQFDSESDYDQLIDAMNKVYGVVVVGGKVRIINKDINSDPEQDIQLMTLDDFKSLTMNKKTVISMANGQSKAVPKSMIWLADERRREYTGGIEFRPDKPREFDGPNGMTYNIFTGWTVEPTEGNWGYLKNHILEVICSGDEEHYNWILDWAADLFQDPFNPKGCAVVMKGLEGSGKGTFFNMLGHCMGRHYKHITQENHLTGNFNGHHQDSLLIFADEVVYGGSKKHAGVLKALVTEKKLTVERKGIDAYQYNNCARVGIASNEDWFIPAGPESRRWFVIETNNKRTKDFGWFEKIYEQMDNGGYEAMMHELLNREITSNLRRAPETRLLEDQRQRYASSKQDTVEEWWADCLERGQIQINDFGSDEDGMEGHWPTIVDRITLFDKYEEWCVARRFPPNAIANKGSFYTRMEKFGLKNTRPCGQDVIDRMGGVRKRCLEMYDCDYMTKIYEEVTGHKL